MSAPKARLRLLAGGSAEVEVDGHRIEDAVAGLRLDAEANCLPRLHLDLHLFDVDVEGAVSILVPERTRRALIALGWTPPEN